MNEGVLVVDDDPIIRSIIGDALQDAGVQVYEAGGGREGLDLVGLHELAAVILDLGLPDLAGEEVLETLSTGHPDLPVVVITAKQDVQTVVQCMRAGARDFVEKPFDETRIVTTVQNAIRQRQLERRLESIVEEKRQTTGLDTLRGNSTAIEEVRQLTRKAIGSDVTILIEGESGTGKEVLARAIHVESTRSSGPFVPVNCGAIPDALIESELFGHEKGAFTGASSQRAGVFEQAHGGTLFLDEIGELRPDLQVRLLRVLQERSVTRVGGNTPRPVDFRVVAATNRVLREEVDKGSFREDLFYRLAVFPISMPPLRERAGDVLLLAEFFLASCAERSGKKLIGFTDDFGTAVSSYSWPGNVRQLQNVIERAVILCEGQELGLVDLSDEIVCHVFGESDLPVQGSPEPRRDAVTAPIVPLEEVERRTIEAALQQTNWNVKLTAEQLGIGRATLYRRIHQFGLDRGDPGSSEEAKS